MNIPKIEELKPSQCREIVFKVNYPEFYEYLNEVYPSDLPFAEKLYWYYNGIEERPCCELCGKPTKFENSIKGYRRYCSRECLNKDPRKKEITRQVCQERYGGNAPICSDVVREKMKNTNLEKYGVENCQQNEEIKSKTINTIISRYGGQGNGSCGLKKKFIDTCIERYGVDNPTKSDEVRNKLSETRRNYVIDNHKYIDEYVEVDGKTMCKCCCPHPECDVCDEKFFMIDPSILANRLSHNIEICTRILPQHPLSSSFELKICEILDEYGIEYQKNVRNVISKELDIYIPSKRVAIEFNGVYWHSEDKKDNKYHYKKYVECKDKGIQLISVWEDLFVNKPDIMVSIILSKLGIFSERIYARKCDIREIDVDTYSKFLVDNHIQGNTVAKVKYGLFHSGQLVSVMSFGKRIICGKENWELIRYCSRRNTIVVGGSSKLFNRFIKDYEPNEIISWSSNDISDGNMYRMLGFLQDNISFSYWYVDRKTLERYHRTSFTKDKIVKMGYGLSKDQFTESSAMKELGYLKIWDSGQTKWIWRDC